MRPGREIERPVIYKNNNKKTNKKKVKSMTHLGAVFGHHKNNSYGWWPTHYCCHHGVTR